MPIDPELWRGRRVLLTGHTGFKGTWLSLWLQQLGAQLTGVAPGPPSSPSLYALSRLSDRMAGELAIDVRDAAALRAALADTRPEVVIHLAAQPMVRRSLIDPVGTYEVNVIGTVNLLDAVRHAGGGVRAVVLVTSDKCYENEPAAVRPFVEHDQLGGSDPYSSSKACAELVATAYRRSFFGGPDAPRVATARAGNVIGGGDWGEDRLLPDAVRVATGITPPPLMVRNPQAIRPWQHVLNPLSGYLVLAQELLRDGEAAGAWNFGPPLEEARSVGWVVERLRELWDGLPAWKVDGGPNPAEARRLALDSGRARRLLGWRSAWDLDRALQELVDWHRSHIAGKDMRTVSVVQLARFASDLAAAHVEAPAADLAAAHVEAPAAGAAVVHRARS